MHDVPLFFFYFPPIVLLCFRQLSRQARIHVALLQSGVKAQEKRVISILEARLRSGCIEVEMLATVFSVAGSLVRPRGCVVGHHVSFIFPFVFSDSSLSVHAEALPHLRPTLLRALLGLVATLAYACSVGDPLSLQCVSRRNITIWANDGQAGQNKFVFANLCSEVLSLVSQVGRACMGLGRRSGKHRELSRLPLAVQVIVM